MGSSLLQRTQPLLLGALFLATTLLGSACNGRPRLDPDAGMSGGTVRGLAIKGRISGGTVRVFRLTPAAERGAEVATAPTGEDGSFTVAVGASEGPFLVAVREGSFRDEASGAVINLNADELTAIVPSFSPGTRVEGLLVTPISHLAAALAFRYVQSEALSVAAAHDEAWLHLNSHFGNIDWKRVVPKDLTSDTGSQFDQPAKAGLLLAALSMEARIISENANLTPGGGVQSLSLTQALYADAIADGFFDGVGPNGRIVLPPGGAVSPTKPTAYELDGYTLRFALAQAVVRFLQSDKKTYNLSTTDVTQLLQDLSRNSNPRIFRASKPGHAFYDQPPTVTFSVKFRAADGVDRTPVGSQQYVAGVLTVTAEAHGPSGARSLVVKVGDSVVPPQAQGNTSSHYVGTWDTRGGGEGPLTFIAYASDLYDNQGQTDFVVTVDNLKPQIAVALPVVGAYSAAISADATATDPGTHSSGIASFGLEGATGFIDIDTARTHVLGTWTLPASASDGPTTLSYVSCDGVANCAREPVVVNIDREPPSVALSAGVAVPQYTTSASLVLYVNAVDGMTGSGVRAVRAQRLGASTILDGLYQSDTGRWLLPPISLAEGPNEVIVWAEDNAVPSNSGHVRGSPSAMTLSIWRDTQAPEPAPAVVASYFDERSMDLDIAPNGLPYVPAHGHFNWPNGTTKVGATEDIYKSDVRRSWGPSVPLASELETTNSFNTPFLQVMVAHAPTDSPITLAAYSFGGTEFALLPSPRVASGQLFFDIPIAAENVPTISSATSSPVTFPVYVRLKDAAGNDSGLRMIIPAINYHLVGSPVQVVQDTGYGSWDPLSAAAFSIRGGSLVSLWNTASGAFQNGNEVRYLRYLIRNPHPVPVLATLSIEGSWSATETWTDTIWEYRSPPRPGDGLPDVNQRFSVRTGDDYRDLPSTRQWGHTSPFSCGTDDYFPCQDPNRQYPRHTGSGCAWPDQRLSMCCSAMDEAPPTAGTSSSVVAGSGSLSAQVFNSDGSRTTLGAGAPVRFLVPAATGSIPGQLNVYGTRPQVSRSPLLSYRDLGGPGAAIQFWQFDYYVRSFNYQCCLAGCSQWELNRFSRLLAAATNAGSGTLTIKTVPTGGNYAAYGHEHEMSGVGSFLFTVSH